MDDLIFRPDKDKLKEIHNKRKWENEKVRYIKEQTELNNVIDFKEYKIRKELMLKDGYINKYTLADLMLSDEDRIRLEELLR